MKKRFLSLFVAIMLVTSGVFAHSGRTDAYGGHRDTKNVSGLGSYHYHCGGYPPHLHLNGICPYTGLSNNNPSYPNSYPTVKEDPMPQLENNGVTYEQNGTKGATVPQKSGGSVSQKTLNYNGKSAQVNTVIKNGVSLMEVRSFVNAMGFVLASENGAIVVSGYDKTLYLYPNSTKVRRWNGATASSEELVSPVKTQAIGGRTYVPARFLVESLGYSIAFDGNSYSVEGGNQSIRVPDVPSQGYYSNSQPQSEDIRFFYERFIYKNNNLDIKMARRGEKIWINAPSIASLCGLHSEIKTLENGKKYILIDNYDVVGAYSKNSRMVGFDEGSSSYPLQIGGKNKEFEWMYAEIEAFIVGDSFYVPAVDFFVGIGLNPEYTGLGTILTDVRF